VWLTKVSTLSKVFHEAAMAVLFYSPPLLPVYKARGLQRLLDIPQDALSTTYHNKIKRLDVEVRHLLIVKGGIDLVALIKHTPLLEVLHLYHYFDSKGRPCWPDPSAFQGKTWSYPCELFEGLDDNNIRLKGWSWNGRFPDTPSVLDQMEQTHERTCLQSLKSLSLWNLAMPEKTKEKDKGALEQSLASAVSILSELRKLDIHNCSMISRKVLASCTSNLQNLSITHCGNFTSSDLKLYLISYGHSLEELVLNGNQALDMGFADRLNSLCPRLRLLEMDLTYSDPSSYHDIEPHYEAMFPKGSMPTWPCTLQTVSLEYMRNLNSLDAEAFLRSLVDAAPKLKDLRKLNIRILLQQDSWRERARLRQTWMRKLERVFLRKADPPQVFVPRFFGPQSFRAEASRPSTSQSTNGMSTTTDSSTYTRESNRKSARIAKRETEGLFDNRGGTGGVTAGRRNQGAEDTASDEEELPLQGMCSEVILHIDGQRPAEARFIEDDFLDDELSGDEDWNGRDLDLPLRHAW
jgi:hypothetical protein